MEAEVKSTPIVLPEIDKNRIEKGKKQLNKESNDY